MKPVTLCLQCGGLPDDYVREQLAGIFPGAVSAATTFPYQNKTMLRASYRTGQQPHNHNVFGDCYYDDDLRLPESYQLSDDSVLGRHARGEDTAAFFSVRFSRHTGRAGPQPGRAGCQPGSNAASDTGCRLNIRQSAGTVSVSCRGPADFMNIVSEHLRRFAANRQEAIIDISLDLSFLFDHDDIPADAREWFENQVRRLRDKSGAGTIMFSAPDTVKTVSRSFNTAAWLREHAWTAYHGFNANSLTAWALRGSRRFPALGRCWTRCRDMDRRLPASVERILQWLFRLTGEPDHDDRFRGRMNFAAINWTGTRAYSLNPGSIFLNVQNREPWGIVNKGIEFNELRDSLINDLQQSFRAAGLTDLSVQAKEKVFAGKYFRNAPDLIIVSAGTETALTGTSGIQKQQTRTICPDGRIFLSGPQFKPADKSLIIQVEDILPLFLYSLGVKGPAGLDGTIHPELFTDEYLRNFPVELYIPPKDTATVTDIGALRAGISKADEDRIKADVQKLGYGLRRK